MKNLCKLLGKSLFVASLLFLSLRFYQNLDKIPNITWSINSIALLIVTVILASFTVALGALAWSFLLPSIETSLSFKQAYVIMSQAQLAKYVPGNFWHYLGRAAIGKSYGISSEAALISISVETVLITMTASLIAIVGFLFYKKNVHAIFAYMNLPSLNLYFFIIFLLFIFVIIFIFLFPYLRDWIILRISYLNPWKIIFPSLLYSMTFVIMGIVTMLLIKIFSPGNKSLSLTYASWGFAVAWLAGFLIPVAPGGLGIREAILITLYSHNLGDGLAISLAFALRIMTILGDLLSFILAKRSVNFR